MEVALIKLFSSIQRFTLCLWFHSMQRLPNIEWKFIRIMWSLET